MIFERKKQYTFLETTSSENSLIISQTWVNSDGEIDNPNGPALIEYCEESGKTRCIAWVSRGWLDRPAADGPALIEYHHLNGTETHSYYRMGRIFRPVGPSVITFEIGTDRVMEELSFQYDPAEGRDHEKYTLDM